MALRLRLLLHQTLQNFQQFIDCFIVTFADVIRHTGTQMIPLKHLVKAVERCIRRCHLDQNIRTIGILLHHIADSADLPFDAV